MVGHGGSTVGSYLTDHTSPIASHCASIVMTTTLRVNHFCFLKLRYFQSAMTTAALATTATTTKTITSYNLFYGWWWWRRRRRRRWLWNQNTKFMALFKGTKQWTSTKMSWIDFHIWISRQINWRKIENYAHSATCQTISCQHEGIMFKWKLKLGMFLTFFKCVKTLNANENYVTGYIKSLPVSKGWTTPFWSSDVSSLTSLPSPQTA